MTGLAEFLRARYAERREQVQGHDDSYNDADGCWGLHEDPAFVLADLDAKAALVDEHSNVSGSCAVCTEPETFDEDYDGNREWTRSAKPYPCRTLRLLAQPFAAHPDYLRKWAS